MVGEHKTEETASSEGDVLSVNNKVSRLLMKKLLTFINLSKKVFLQYILYFVSFALNYAEC